MKKNDQLILVVEDDPINRELAVKILTYYGYRTECASNGQEALESVKHKKPALILMDLSLPILDGWHVTRKIREKQEYADIIIIALTAHAMSADKKKALDVGCNAYLSKPYTSRLLIELLNKYL